MSGCRQPMCCYPSCSCDVPARRVAPEVLEEGEKAAKLLPPEQRRRQRVAATLCACQMTDGLCTPLNKPECRCWKLADTVLRAIDDWPAKPHLKGARG